MDILKYNQHAWDQQVAKGNPWTQPVDPETIAAARQGEWSVVLTPIRPVPRDWFPEMAGTRVLCLACGGGQQAPVFAAAGANVTVLDMSPAQLAQDRTVADREGLVLRTELGDMADLRIFADQSFDLVFHPCSNCFVPNVRPVWREASRVLRPGGYLLAGFCNPLLFLFDEVADETEALIVRHSLPHSDLIGLSEEQRQQMMERNEPLAFGHTLEDQIGGQLDSGFVLTNLYEDKNPKYPLSKYSPTFIATRAMKARV